MSLPQTERLKLLIAYDGRSFSGWQSQPCGGGVQDHLEAAFERITGARVAVHGSGRTDAGVHALGQVAHADVPKGKHKMAVWQTALNGSLPFEVRVLRVSRVPGGKEGFHARYDAKGKIYIYRIATGSYVHPLEMGRVWHVPGAFDIGLMREAAKPFIGKHDFAAFAANRGVPEKDTHRTIREILVNQRNGIVTVSIEGDGFLYKMVRLLTGSMVRVAQGKQPLTYIEDLLRCKGTRKTQFAAPAEGLYLKRVKY